MKMKKITKTVWALLLISVLTLLQPGAVLSAAEEAEALSEGSIAIVETAEENDPAGSIAEALPSEGISDNSGETGLQEGTAPAGEVIPEAEEISLPPESEAPVDTNAPVDAVVPEEAPQSASPVSANEEVVEAAPDDLPPNELSTTQRETAQILTEELAEIATLDAGEDYVVDEAVFMADNGTEAEKVAEQYGAELKSYAEGVATLVFPEGKTTEEAMTETVNAIAAFDPDSAVSASSLPDTAIAPNYLYYIDVNPNDDPLYKNSSRAPKGQWFHESINTPGAWAKGADGSGVKVAVVDTGIDTSNNDLNCSQVLYTASYRSGEDDNGHGTHCAGIIAGLDNTVGGLGVAPEATLISVKAASAEGRLKDSDIAEGIRKAADAGADVISMSFGGSGTNTATSSAIEYAIKKGAVCIAAAGNESTSSKRYPACYTGVIAVGAYASDDTLSSFSNYGSWVSLAAPGSDILATMVDDPTANLRVNNAFWDTYTDTCSYGKLNGTSMATPVVSGVAALVKSLHKNYSVNQIKNALLNSNPNVSYKYSGHTVNKGINALNAVTLNVEQGSNPSNPPVGENDYLFFGVGPAISVKQGKNVVLGAHTSLDTKKNKIRYTVSGNNMITVTTTGTVKVNKKAEIGSTATITATCATLTARTTVTVIDASTPSAKFTLKTDQDGSLFTVEGYNPNSANITMVGGDADRPYRYVISGKNIALFKNGRPAGYASIGGAIVPVYAKNTGTATITAYATDGSGYKASVKVKCVTPLTGVNITYGGAPITGQITMARGASLQLKPAAVGSATSKVTGTVKYTWSGDYVNKTGKVTAPDDKESFTVTVTAQCNGLTATKSVTILSRWTSGKIKLLGYAYQGRRGYTYYSSIRSNGTSSGEDYMVGGRYGISEMPDLSNIGLQGPYGFTKTTAKSWSAYLQYAREGNNGFYTIAVTGPSVTNVTYSDYGVQSFVPMKKGNYKFIFTSMDGSGKKFTINFKVTADAGSNSEQAPNPDIMQECGNFSVPSNK